MMNKFDISDKKIDLNPLSLKFQRAKGGEKNMVSYKTKLGTAIATVSLLASVYAPLAYADTDITIADNGANSTNNVTVTNNDTTNITQTNNFTVTLDVTSKAKTGGNEASNNTGGDVSIDTGNASSTVNVSVQGGSNSATIHCACNTTNDTINVSNNGADSNNTANVTNKKKKIVSQTNNGSVGGTIKSKAKTGKNKANGNTNGTVNITTGNSTSNVTTNVTAPSNTVNLTP